MNTLTKLKLAKELSRASNLSLAGAQKLITNLFDAMATHLQAEGRIEIRNFGTFSTRKTKPRTGRNPKQPEVDIPIPARIVVKFKSSKKLKKKI